MKKKILLTIGFVILSVCSFAQTVKSSIPLKVVVEDMVQPFPSNAKTQLINKANQMLTANGLSSIDTYSDFVLTVVANPIEKSVVPSAPVQIIQSVDFTFYIVDCNRQIVFSTYSTTAKGVGDSEAKSYLDAMKKLNVRSKEAVSFVDQGRERIIDWYEAEADNIFAKVKVLTNQLKYEEAFYELCGFPTECSKYLESIELGNEIYQGYIDHNAQLNLNKAKMAWAAEQNSAGAEKAGVYLAEVLPEASCYKEAEALYLEMKSKVLDDLKFEMKKYQDKIDMEKYKIETQKEVDMLRINAWKEVGVAFGNNQKAKTINLSWLRKLVR